MMQIRSSRRRPWEALEKEGGRKIQNEGLTVVELDEKDGGKKTR